MDTNDVRERLFSGIYPCGIVYADRKVEVAGDYKRLGFLSYATLQLDLEADCPADLREPIIRDAAAIQAREGQRFRVSSSDQFVMLGRPA